MILAPTDLRARRKSLGLSQAALARELGVSPHTIAVWERGEQCIEHPEMVDKALRHLEHTCRHCGKTLTHHDNLGCCRKCAMAQELEKAK